VSPSRRFVGAVAVTGSESAASQGGGRAETDVATATTPTMTCRWRSTDHIQGRETTSSSQGRQGETLEFSPPARSALRSTRDGPLHDRARISRPTTTAAAPTATSDSTGPTTATTSGNLMTTLSEAAGNFVTRIEVDRRSSRPEAVHPKTASQQPGAAGIAIPAETATAPDPTPPEGLRRRARTFGQRPSRGR